MLQIELFVVWRCIAPVLLSKFWTKYKRVYLFVQPLNTSFSTQNPLHIQNILAFVFLLKFCFLVTVLGFFFICLSLGSGFCCDLVASMGQRCGSCFSFYFRF